jgi:hypothetical protein
MATRDKKGVSLTPKIEDNQKDLRKRKGTSPYAR